jgi:hypothetical protein
MDDVYFFSLEEMDKILCGDERASVKENHPFVYQVCFIFLYERFTCSQAHGLNIG